LSRNDEFADFELWGNPDQPADPEGNTREGIWNAMRAKETYGTSRTMIRLRFFGG
jgi:hypothetical protein